MLWGLTNLLGVKLRLWSKCFGRDVAAVCPAQRQDAALKEMVMVISDTYMSKRDPAHLGRQLHKLPNGLLSEATGG